jgi:hypothetical protein
MLERGGGKKRKKKCFQAHILYKWERENFGQTIWDTQKCGAIGNTLWGTWWEHKNKNIVKIIAHAPHAQGKKMNPLEGIFSPLNWLHANSIPN